MNPPLDATQKPDAAAFWDKHYQSGELSQNPPANAVLRDVAHTLQSGSALDLGCGTGGDALWLARRGWSVTATDISPTAVSHVSASARALGLADTVHAVCHDLSATFPDGHFDLVSAQYLQTPFDLPRAQILRRAAHALTPAGLLLIVDHGSAAPWSWNKGPGVRFPLPSEVAAELALDPAVWRIERAQACSREAVGPSGEHAEVIDHVLQIRRITS
ncbi:class I SAM-dependent methyltransferase [Rhodococcus sp. G-MC3]|uniref:SAM-dependent methyltransferase n=1 Tax=Rhodococcus sp. G-MC3 TaxID=3046209 RepID=UPI0024BB49D0|nr:class I SAM-dependent methyltransferase [Rhodococcus sp. G-MC3]MDJ0396513.1 class I SAM-dependent methyltransferase [Rhodococcus sp. G-MC3]